jgi:8-oxo-dGTP diphosphatase
MSTVHLIRHAKAKNRLKWTEPDQRRPLTKRGRREAAAIASRLEDEPIVRLVSSPYLRCLQTLEPLASVLDVSVETSDLLAEGADGQQAHELLLSLAAAGPIACCTHGDVLYEVVSLVARSGLPLDGSLLAPVASTWVLDVEDDRIVRARFVEQPPR